MGSTQTSRRWIRLGILAVIATLTVGVSACGSAEDESGGAGATVTVQHARGETQITGAPKRIVALGNQWLDTVLALDITPVGYLDNVAIIGDGRAPWQPDRLGGSKSISSTGNIVEQVIALEPDLVLVDNFIADEKRYGDLSKVVPTVAGLGAEITSPWQDLVTTLGKIVHEQDKATQVVNGLNAKIDGLAAANPGLRGKTYASTWLGSASQLMVLADPRDGSGKVFTQLGLTIPANILALPANQGRASLSTERLEELQSDLLLAGYSGNFDEKYRALPGYANLPAVQKDAVVFLTVQEITVVNQPTVLTIPYILDKISPALVNAAK
ncbi:ABC transporter substrate-binding protein [Nocardia sp. 2]|uniref:ABC transporter substrate-binding protein n=1 Tax=Nocardia acididurans TaxID=2802282 RepID=A0ABS1MAE6_9NOCA|nr:ABC transporter substrate-binding protein [Nocardia acididurans]MBL1077224.1 ABC transporter substrate-binding protein [Nocardia acididurans]